MRSCAYALRSAPGSMRTYAHTLHSALGSMRLRTHAVHSALGDKMDEVASRRGVQKYALCYTQLRTALRNLGVRRDILYGQH